jgi:hypothetical protein
MSNPFGRPLKRIAPGTRFGVLEVVGLDHVDRRYGAMYLVRCTNPNCLRRKIMRGSDLRAGRRCRCGATWY